MTPTYKLRFVERTEPLCPGVDTGRIIRVLQQWWAVERHGQITPEGEWRDVPLER